MDKQKKLFRIIPDNFFSPLSSPGKMVYWECIEILFHVSSSQLSFGVERDVLVGELEEYFSSSMSADIEEREYLDETDTKSMSPRDKANFMLRRLEACGWIYTDTDYSYVQRTSFRDYAISVIRTLLDIEDEHKAEYQGYIYAIYTMARANGNNAVGLRQMVENTDALITGLKSLNANIKIYIDDLTKHSTVSEILDALLNDYYSNVIDKAYHRLLTSDNVCAPEAFSTSNKASTNSFRSSCGIFCIHLRILWSVRILSRVNSGRVTKWSPMICQERPSCWSKPICELSTI